MKNNIQLVEYAKAQIGRPYWFGTFGQTASEVLLNQKAAQYPKMYTKKRITKAKAEHIGKRVHDCMGLIKGFIWSADANSAPKYKASEDWSADVAFEKATEKGPIATIPEIPGVLVRYRGHVGVYIGGGEVIEARGFDYGIVKTKLSERPWLNWYKYSLIEYVNVEKSEPQEPKEEPAGIIEHKVKKGETLTKIAKKYDVTVAAIVRANNIPNPDIIRIGQVLTIPKATEPEKKTASGIVNTNLSNLNIRAGASMDAAIIGTLPKGTRISIELPEKSGFYKLANRAGFVSSQFIKIDN